MARSSAPAITAAKLDECLDKLAFVMSRATDPSVYLPLWKRLENERALCCDVEDVLAAATARFKQSKGRTEARS